MCLGNMGCDGLSQEPRPAQPSLGQSTQALQGETCVTLQRSKGSAVADAKISNRQADKNFSREPVASVSSVNSHVEHLLLRFDTSAIPSSATVASARLTLWQVNSGQAASLRIHAVTQPWAENSVTWSSFRSAFNPGVVASLETTGASSSAARTVDVSSLVSTWVHQPSGNHGLLIAQPAGKTLVDTSESPHADRQPRLEVCYSQVPQGTEPEGTSLLLEVVSEDGSPVAGAAISTQGAVFPTDSSGHLLLENLPPGRFHARVDAPGFTSAAAVVELNAGAHRGYRVKLLPLAAPILFQAEAGGTLTTEDVRVVIPPGAVVDALGQPVTGTVEVTIAPLDPTAQLASMPGPLEGSTPASGEETLPLESLFMAEVSLWSHGAPVNLAPGAKATLEFVLPDTLASQFQAGDTVPAWWFDLDAGHWRQEGEGTIQPSQTQPGKRVWSIEVGHFTWWNCDVPITDRSCVNVRVVDGLGTPVPNMPLYGQGVSYTGLSRPATTAPNGRACLEIKRGHTANIFAGLVGEPSSGVVTVTGSQAASVCGSTSCTEVQLVVQDPICTPGAYLACPYSGPANTLGQGRCQAGHQRCNVVGTEWSACQGEVLPSAESCSSPFDEDCDGEVNEGCSCSTQVGQPCYGGAAPTEGVGICRGGTVACDLFGNVTCQGQQRPQPESCSTLADDDCDGSNECTPVKQWLFRLSDSQDTSCVFSGLRALTVDSQGNSLLAGQFQGTLTFAGTSLTAQQSDLFLAKLDTHGQPVWGQVIPGQFSDVRVSTDGAGNLTVAAVFDGLITVGGLTLGTLDQRSVLVAKYSSGGALQWAQGFSGNTSWLYLKGLNTDAEGNVALSGQFQGTVQIGSQVLEPDLNDPWQGIHFVAKLDASTGTPQWSRTLGMGAFVSGIDAALAAQGHMVVAGSFTGQFTVDGEVLTNFTSPAVFGLKLDGGTGLAVWSQVSEPESPAELYPRVKVDGAGNVVVLAWVPSTMATLTQFSPQGQVRWKRRLGAPGNGYLSATELGLDLDTAGNILVSGWFVFGMDLGGGPRYAYAPAGFLAWYDANGGYLAEKFYGGQDPGETTNIGFLASKVAAGIDAAGNAVLGATQAGPVDFGDGTPISWCGGLTVLKLDPTP